MEGANSSELEPQASRLNPLAARAGAPLSERQYNAGYEACHEAVLMLESRSEEEDTPTGRQLDG
jgi:hypothetical protein